jgi:acetylornithine deacetylase/succinyl-diaminopimelate desuccinylase-like protein
MALSADDVAAKIDSQEVTDLALALGNIDSPHGDEGAAAQYVFDWLSEHGFKPRKIGVTEDRFNVAARMAGAGGGYSLLFNSHLDTTLRPDAIWSARNPTDPMFHTAWIEGDLIFGDGVVNDKGPMAAFLVAAKAIRDSGYPMLGDLYVTAVMGEISREPVDEYRGSDYLSKDIGARFMVTHGVVADFALVAEGTGFGIVCLEAGKAQFKMTVFSDGPLHYTPYIPRPTEIVATPNAIVRSSVVIQAFEEWAYDFERRMTYVSDAGTIVPKASIGAIRAGYPYSPTNTPQVCSLYIDTRLLPGMNPNDVRDELLQLLDRVGIPGEVELFLYRPGFETRGAERLIETIRRCHGKVFPNPPTTISPSVSSMWRDTNAFLELGIPAVSYAPRAAAHATVKAFKVSDLINAANVYARIAMDLCNQPRPAYDALGAHPGAEITRRTAQEAH